MEPRWLAPVTWRLVGIATLVAVASSARHVIAVLAATEKPSANDWPFAMVFLLSYVIAGLTMVFAGAFLIT